MSADDVIRDIRFIRRTATISTYKYTLMDTDGDIGIPIVCDGYCDRSHKITVHNGRIYVLIQAYECNRVDLYDITGNSPPIGIHSTQGGGIPHDQDVIIMSGGHPRYEPPHLIAVGYCWDDKPYIATVDWSDNTRPRIVSTEFVRKPTLNIVRFICYAEDPLQPGRRWIVCYFGDHTVCRAPTRMRANIDGDTIILPARIPCASLTNAGTIATCMHSRNVYVYNGVLYMRGESLIKVDLESGIITAINDCQYVQTDHGMIRIANYTISSVTMGHLIVNLVHLGDGRFGFHIISVLDGSTYDIEYDGLDKNTLAYTMLIGPVNAEQK